MSGVRDEYAPLFGRERLTVWGGDWASELVGSLWELPNRDGYMFTPYYRSSGPRVRITCATPRTDDNYLAVDAAILSALAAGSRADA